MQLSATVSASTTLTSEKYDDWFYFSNNTAISSAQNDKQQMSDSWMELATQGDFVTLSVTLPQATQCLKGQESVIKGEPILFGKRWLNIKQQCKLDGSVVFTPVTRKGLNYMVNYLKSVNEVTLFSSRQEHLATFSARGFNLAFAEIKKRMPKKLL